MDEHQLLSLVTTAKAEFGAPCKKFSGAVTAELLKKALQQNGIHTSARDVFIERVPVEIDLLIAKRDVTPRHGILYCPQDVLMVFEIKFLGSFGEGTLEKTAKDFGLVRAQNPRISCVYVTLTERRGYKWAVSESNFPHPAFTLFWYRGSVEGSRRYEASGDFAKLLKEIRAVLEQHT